MKSWAAAIFVIAKIRRSDDEILAVQYNDLPLQFRGLDAQALKEVLVDREYDFLEAIISQESSPTVLDVGAHIGTFAMWVLSCNERATILSVEADPATFEVAEANADEYSNRGFGWKVIHAAAAGPDDQTVMIERLGPSMSHRVSEDGDIEVKVVDLNSLLNQFPTDKMIDILKIDIEGSEERFLCVDTNMARRIRNLVVELHPDLCDANRVRLVLEQAFETITEIGGRSSSKPLLYCHGIGTGKSVI